MRVYQKDQGFGIVVNVEPDGLCTVAYENSTVEDHGISLQQFNASFVLVAEGVVLEAERVEREHCLEEERQIKTRCDKVLSLVKRAVGDPIDAESKIFSNPPDENDLALIDIWLRDQRKEDSESERMRLLSARQAEKAIVNLVKRWGIQVTDVSIQQVMNPSCGDWKGYDIRVGDECIDVKNARRSAKNRDFYVSHCVPRFKESRSGGHVKIAGILSEWLKLDQLLRGGSEVLFLGFTTMPRIDQVARLFHLDSLEFFLNTDGKGRSFFLPGFSSIPISTIPSGVQDWLSSEG